MAFVIVTIRIMPKHVESDLKRIKEEAYELIKEFGGDNGSSEIEPIAFGLNALKITFMYDESKGSPDELEKSITEIEDVQSAETTDVRRALG